MLPVGLTLDEFPRGQSGSDRAQHHPPAEDPEPRRLIRRSWLPSSLVSSQTKHAFTHASRCATSTTKWWTHRSNVAGYCLAQCAPLPGPLFVGWGRRATSTAEHTEPVQTVVKSPCRISEGGGRHGTASRRE